MYFPNMEQKSRKGYNTTLDVELMKQIKILAIERDCKVNDLLEEAMTDLLKKYAPPTKDTKKS